MQLQLKRPICFFDLETTGINITNDRIVEISILKVFPNGKEERHTWLVNPTIPIPPEVTAVHGISDADVANKPPFKELAKEVYQLIKDSDLAGFNFNRFDIPLLAVELLRAEVDFVMKNRVSVDVQTIFHKMEKRNLSAAYKFYCSGAILSRMEGEFTRLNQIYGNQIIFSGTDGDTEWGNRNTRFLKPLYTDQVLKLKFTIVQKEEIDEQFGKIIIDFEGSTQDNETIVISKKNIYRIKKEPEK